MNDPYSVLGVNRSADMDEIKKVYRDLVKKYHPDNYVGNELADLAQEKMKEINQAYDAIVREREGKKSPDKGGWAGPSGGGYGEYARVRSLIQSGKLAEAGSILESITDRAAEWYFCMGSLCYRRGWFDEAVRNFQKAASMEPGNIEYGEAVRRTSYGPRGGYYGRPVYTGGGLSACDCCTTMLCAECLCGNCC